MKALVVEDDSLFLWSLGQFLRKEGLRQQSFSDIWEKSSVFAERRDTSNLTGKCGCCEYKKVCEGCRARAYAETGNYLAEEPYCNYIRRTMQASFRTTGSSVRKQQ
jgi:radical SAM protein with 4Fe4S-binding SPASM domain